MLNKKEGKYEEALTCYKTALQIGKFFFGASHPSIGMYLTNLGDIYRKQGNFNKAEGIYSQVFLLFYLNLVHFLFYFFFLFIILYLDLDLDLDFILCIILFIICYRPCQC